MGTMILFEGESVDGCLLALRDTFGPYLADAACLLFTDDGRRGVFLDRNGVLGLSLPRKLPGPYTALIRASNVEAAMGRLGLMAAPMHSYGKGPRVITDEEATELIKEAQFVQDVRGRARKQWWQFWK